MKEFSVVMALADFLPVGIFLASFLILSRFLNGKLSSRSFTLFSAGMVDVFLAGFLKATYKLLYAANVCDFSSLNTLFLPLQSIGLLLAGIGTVGLCKKKKETVLYGEAIPTVFTGTLLFIPMMVLGQAMFDVGLCVCAAKEKKKPAIVFFTVNLLLMLGMGYLSSRDFDTAAANWAAEGVNVVGQGMLLIGALILTKRTQKET